MLPQVQNNSTMGNLGDFFIRKLLLEVRMNVLQGRILRVREPSVFNKMFLDVPNLSRPGLLEVIMFPLSTVLLLTSAIEEVSLFALLTRNTHVPYSNTSKTFPEINVPAHVHTRFIWQKQKSIFVIAPLQTNIILP